MNTRALNELAEVVRRAQAEGRRTPMGVAMAVESAVVEPLRARVAELEAQRERRRVRLVALQNDALNMRGSLSPMGEDRKVPFPLGETLTPAVDWLIGRIAELEAERHTTNEALSDAAEALRAQQDRIAELEQREAAVAAFVAARAGYITAIRNCHNGHDYDRWQGHAAARRQLSELLGLPVAWPPEDSASVEKSTAKLKQVLAPAEGEFHDVLHHSYDTPHDLPAPGDRQ